MAKIFWTIKEKEALRSKTYEIYNRPVFFQSLFDAFSLAQRDVLPEDRKRTVTPQQIVWVLEGEPLEGNSGDYAKSYLSVLCAKLKTNKPTPVAKKRRVVKEVSERGGRHVRAHGDRRHAGHIVGVDRAAGICRPCGGRE
jgi:hypothetical protein